MRWRTFPSRAGRRAGLRILAVRSDGLGDVLLTGPALRALAAEGDEVTLLTGPDGAPAAPLLEGVTGHLVYECPWIAADPPPLERAGFEGLVDAVRGREFDLAVIFTSARQSPLPMAMALRLAGVPCIGAHSEHYPGALVDVRLRGDADVHEVERNLALTTALGFAEPDDRRLRVGIGELPARLRRVVPEDAVVVHPGATAPARSLTADRWAAIVHGLARAGHPVLLTGTAGDAVTHVVRRLTADARGVVDLVGRTGLGDLAAVIAGAAAVCVGNTGAMHLAAAVGTPVVACFPPTVPTVRWRPWLVPHELLGRSTPCAPCYQRECPVPSHPCAAIRPADVVAAVERLRTPARPPVEVAS